MTKEDEDLFASISLPMVKTGYGKPMAENIPPMYPMTIEEAANGRTIKDYPYKFDDFLDYRMLEAYIMNEIAEEVKTDNKKYVADRLTVSTTSVLHFSTPDTYYRSTETIDVNLLDGNVGCMRNDKKICTLNRKNWSFMKVDFILKRIKRNIQKQP